MTELPFAYKGEAQLVRWSETPKGRTVTLLLDPFVGEQHPFKALKCGENGQRMQLAAVLVGDDDQPVPPKNGPSAARGRSASCHPHADQAKPEDKPRTYTRSQRAAIMCQDPQFQAWLSTRYADTWAGLFYSAPGEQMKAEAISWDVADMTIKSVLKVASKRELDTDPEAAARFDALRTDFELRDLVR